MNGESLDSLKAVRVIQGVCECPAIWVNSELVVSKLHRDSIISQPLQD